MEITPKGNCQSVQAAQFGSVSEVVTGGQHQIGNRLFLLKSAGGRGSAYRVGLADDLTQLAPLDRIGYDLFVGGTNWEPDFYVEPQIGDRTPARSTD